MEFSESIFITCDHEEWMHLILISNWFRRWALWRWKGRYMLLSLQVISGRTLQSLEHLQGSCGLPSCLQGTTPSLISSLPNMDCSSCQSWLSWRLLRCVSSWWSMMFGIQQMQNSFQFVWIIKPSKQLKMTDMKMIKAEISSDLQIKLLLKLCLKESNWKTFKI